MKEMLARDANELRMPVSTKVPALEQRSNRRHPVLL